MTRNPATSGSALGSFRILTNAGAWLVSRPMTPTRIGSAAEDNEPQRHRGHRDKTHRESTCIVLFFIFLPSLCLSSVFSVPLWFVYLMQYSALRPRR